MARRRKENKPVVVIENATGAHIKWAVLWVVPHEGSYRIIEKTFGNDLSGALSLYTRVVAAGKRLPTLRSCNVGFPPPEKYQPYEKKVKYKEVVKRRGKKKLVTRYKWVDVAPLKQLNKRGVFWCPYCRELRKFQEQGGFYVEGVIVPSQGLYCPIDGTSHRDIHVRRWNPIAERFYLNDSR